MSTKHVRRPQWGVKVKEYTNMSTNNIRRPQWGVIKGEKI